MHWDSTAQQRVKKQALAFFTESFELFYEHSIAIDTRGIVTWISESYYGFLALTSSPIGKPITDIIPNSFLPAVVSRGEPLFLDLLYRDNQWTVVSAIPLQDESGEVVGGFGFVASEGVSQIKPLLTKCNNLQSQLQKARSQLAREFNPHYQLAQIIGQSEALLKVKKQVKQAAGFDISVLLTGETGTGKELFAHALHNLSLRSAGPFIGVNMASIPESLIEAEFFGVAPGAYTGAAKEGRIGKFELASGGTLFLDEIGDMSIETQAKLLRVLQEKELAPLGSNRLVRTDVRIIAATSRNLLEMVDQGHFRPDLYYRLSALPIHLPPLRERPTDIQALCEQFIEQTSAKLGTAVKVLNADALQLLCDQAWPGNIRELYNVIERACVLSERREITAASLESLLTTSKLISTATHSTSPIAESHYLAKPKPLKARLLDAERSAIADALAFTRGQKTQAAKLLGISRASLYEKMKKTGL